MMGELFSQESLPPGGLNPDKAEDVTRFQEGVEAYYRHAGRDMPWRADPSPYWVFVSEIMLQQTQVPRVLQRFPQFVARFPTFAALAEAPFSDVLAEWSGLGYNRRARWLHGAAGRIVAEYGGVLPQDPEILRSLPGIGPNTAGSMAAFAYNRPVVFIETNIRRVFLHTFFPRRDDVHDREIFPLIERTLVRERPREWYWALMDYGVALGKGRRNANRRSRHYTRQKPFADSDRQLRGRVLRLLTEVGSVSAAELPDLTGFSADRVAAVTDQLERERMIARSLDGGWMIAD